MGESKARPSDGPKEGDILVHFQWLPEEFAEVLTHLARERMRSPTWAIPLLLGGAYVAWQIAQAVGAALTDPTAGWVIPVLPWLLVVAMWFWLLTKGPGWLATRRARKVPEGAETQIEQAIGPEGVIVGTRDGPHLMPWEHISKVGEIESHFLWYWGGRAAHYTPKRALDPDELRRVREWIELSRR